MSHGLKLFITGSLLFNLLAAGILIGHLSHPHRDAHTRFTVVEMADRLPEDKREQFKTVMLKAEEDAGPARRELNEARKKADDLLKAEPFNKAAYIAQMQKVHELHGPVMQPTVEAVASIAAQSTPAERARLADLLRHPPHPPGED